MRDDDTHCDENTVRVDSRKLTILVHHVVAVVLVPDNPDQDSAGKRVDVYQGDQSEESVAVDEFASVGKKLSHCEWQILLLFESAVVLEADFLIEDTVEYDEPISHQDIKASDQ